MMNYDEIWILGGLVLWKGCFHNGNWAVSRVLQDFQSRVMILQHDTNL